jgi:cell division septal protein FtsQ
MATDSKVLAQTDRLARLQTYAAMLKQRLSGQLAPEMRNFLQIDLRKTEGVIAKLKG